MVLNYKVPNFKSELTFVIPSKGGVSVIHTKFLF